MQYVLLGANVVVFNIDNNSGILLSTRGVGTLHEETGSIVRHFVKQLLHKEYIAMKNFLFAQNIVRFFENLEAAITFAQAGDHVAALRIMK
ncbi:MAG: hypothetical protein AB7E47_16810 [Desulfovibrionaceae bacterium]